MTNYYLTCQVCRMSLSKSAAVIIGATVYCDACAQHTGEESSNFVFIA